MVVRYRHGTRPDRGVIIWNRHKPTKNEHQDERATQDYLTRQTRCVLTAMLMCSNTKEKRSRILLHLSRIVNHECCSISQCFANKTQAECGVLNVFWDCVFPLINIIPNCLCFSSALRAGYQLLSKSRMWLQLTDRFRTPKHRTP